jgi:hypothetical protein
MQVPQPPPRRTDESDRPNSGGRSIRTGWAEQKTSYESKCDDNKQDNSALSGQKFCDDHNDTLDVDEESKPEIKKSHKPRPLPVMDNVKVETITSKSKPTRGAVEESTDGYKKAMWKGKSNILVAVRVRPLSKTERSRGHRSILEVMDRKVVVVKDPKEKQKKNDILRRNRSREKRYAFDYAFGPNTNSETVYRNTTEFLIDGVLDGYNATVFAYGATGAGKTYTMLGTETQPGIMFQTLKALFDRTNAIEKDTSAGKEYKVSLSYLEVYNELIRDLLTSSSDYLDLREDPIKGPTVSGISEISVDSPEHVMRLLQQGNKRRTQEPTAANQESSRSHAVLQIVIEQRDTAPGVEQAVKIGKLSMIDLAGSERASNTQNRGIRLIEGANINRSLLALGNCINALGEKKGRGGYIPYRDSKLTRLLKDSLGGSCRTVMITNVSPASFHFEETINSLKYANRAKNIKTNVKRNVLNVKYHISEYVSLIKGLKSEISLLRNKLQDGGGKSNNDAAAVDAIVANAEITMEQKREDIRHSKIFEELRTAIVANFRERMQLRRGQIEIESINVQNHIEIERRMATIARLEADLELMGEANDELSGFDDDLDDEIDERIGVTMADDDDDDGNDSDVVIIEEDDSHHHSELSNHTDLEEDECNDDMDEEDTDMSFEGKVSGLDEGKRGDSAVKKIHRNRRLSKNRKPVKRVSARKRRKGAIKTTLKEIEELRGAMDSNARVKDDIMQRLDENKKQSDKMHHDLGRRANSNERRSLMELEYRVLKVELEKLELERSTMLQEMVVKQKNQILDEAKQQLRLRDMIIDAQRQLLMENNIQIGAKLTRMFERLVPMEAFWGTHGYGDAMAGASNSDNAEGGQRQSSLIAQVASELKKVGRPDDDWGISEAVFPESKLKNIETVTYNPTVSIKPNQDYQSDIQTMPVQIQNRSPRTTRSGNPRNITNTAISKKVQRVAAKVRRSKSSAYVNEHNKFQNRLETERKRRRQKRRQRYKERNNSENIAERDENTENNENKNEDKRDNSSVRERKKAKALQKRVLSASGKQWADRLKMYLVTPRKKRSNTNNNNTRASSSKKQTNHRGFNNNNNIVPGTTSPRSRKPTDSKIPFSSSKQQQRQGGNKSKSSKSSIAQSVAQRIANAIKGPSSKSSSSNTFDIASPQQPPAPPPPPKKDASLKSNHSPEDEHKKSDQFVSKPKLERTPPKVNKNLTQEFHASTKMQNDSPKSTSKGNNNKKKERKEVNDENHHFGPILQAGTPLPHIKPKGRWSPVSSPERKNHHSNNSTNNITNQKNDVGSNNIKEHHRGKRGRRRRDKKGIRPVLHRLNAKLRNRNRRGRDRSRNRQDDNNRENNKYDGAMSELPTITNLTLDI